MSVIGEAIVKVKIDTSGAKVDLDAKDREERTERDKRQRDRREKTKREKGGGRFKRVPVTLASTRGMVRALPFAGLVYLYAQYGAAAMDAALSMGDQMAAGKLPPLIRAPLEALLGQTKFLGHKVDQLTSTVEAAFGAVGDTTQVAKAAYLFRSSVDGEDMVDLIEGMFRIRYAQGLGRRTEGKLGRSLIGKGIGEELGKRIKMWE